MILGITGGVGAGKSKILDYLREEYGALVFKADDIAKELLMPGEIVNLKIREMFPVRLFDEVGNIKKVEMSEFLFEHEEYRTAENKIVFPAVKAEILNRLRVSTEHELVVIEAALFFEADFDEICDEVWYIDANEAIRAERLRESRGYSEDKTSKIVNSQMTREEFARRSNRVIDNSGDFARTKTEIEEALRCLGMEKI